MRFRHARGTVCIAHAWKQQVSDLCSTPADASRVVSLGTLTWVFESSRVGMVFRVPELLPAGANPAERAQPLRTYTLGSVVAALTSISISGVVSADLVGSWDLGSGDSTAQIQVDFLSGNSYLFDVSFDSTITGRAVFDVIANESENIEGLDFEFDYIAYSFGDFLVGIEINDSYDYGEGSPPDYLDSWSYWTAEGADDWASSMVGFNGRNLVDGSRDAWVFGTGAAPAAIPAPATMAIFAFGLRRRRRN